MAAVPIFASTTPQLTNVSKQKRKRFKRLKRREKHSHEEYAKQITSLLNEGKNEIHNQPSDRIDHELRQSRDVDAFFMRRIEFLKYTRPDLRQNALKEKYKPINLPTHHQEENDTLGKPSMNGIYTHDNKSDAVKKESNGDYLDCGEALRLATRSIFPADRIQLTWRTVQPIGPGLFNLGNTCFLNSVLQCLTYTPPLAQYLLESGHLRTCRISSFCMLCEMERHVRMCLRREGTHGGAIRPKRIVGGLRLIARHMCAGRQEDAHEFLRYLVDAMQKSCLADYDR
jgi:hypothetical protein